MLEIDSTHFFESADAKFAKFGCTELRDMQFTSLKHILKSLNKNRIGFNQRLTRGASLLDGTGSCGSRAGAVGFKGDRVAQIDPYRFGK
jgi:hypothetical protein